MAATANAGTVYTWLVLDPATTAGAGVAASGGMNVTSTRSGANTFHLYAVDDADGSAGLRSFFVKVNGVVAANNRSPVTQYDDDASFGSGNGPFNAGFNDVRTTTPLIGAAQGATNATAAQIGGFGIGAGNFSTVPGALSFGSTTSGQWGNYAAGDGTTAGIVAASGHTRRALFLGEGTYAAGSPPTIDIATLVGDGGSAFGIWNATGFPNQGASTVSAGGSTNVLSSVNPFGPPVPEPATLTLVGLAVVGFAGFGRRRS